MIRAIGAAALTLLMAMFAFPGAARPEAVAPAAGSPGVETVRLTATLVVNDGAVVRDKHFVWDGPPDAPMLRLPGARSATLDHVSFEVPFGRHATAAVELAGDRATEPSGNSLSHLTIGRFGEPANLDYGVRWTGPSADRSNNLLNVTIFGAARAGLSVTGTDGFGNTIRGLYVFFSPIALATSTPTATTCEGCGFIGSTDVDVELTGGATLTVVGMYSEQSRAFARVVAGPSASGLAVVGGYWQAGDKAAGPMITGDGGCCGRIWVRLEDFNVTPLDGRPGATVVGFSPENTFLSNVAGLHGSS